MATGPTVIGLCFQQPDSWALAELDAGLAYMESRELAGVFDSARARYQAALSNGRPIALLDAFQAAVRDTAPSQEGSEAMS
jgi:hypothetical protein